MKNERQPYDHLKQAIQLNYSDHHSDIYGSDKACFVIHG